MIATFFAATQAVGQIAAGPKTYLSEEQRGYLGARFSTALSQQLLESAEWEYEKAKRTGRTERAASILSYLEKARPSVESRKIMLGMAPQRPQPKTPDTDTIQSYLNFQAAKSFNSQLREETSAPIKTGLTPVGVNYQVNWLGIILLGGIIWFVVVKG